jgi:hypothetical protein
MGACHGLHFELCYYRRTGLPVETQQGRQYNIELNRDDD